MQERKCKFPTKLYGYNQVSLMQTSSHSFHSELDFQNILKLSFTPTSHSRQCNLTFSMKYISTCTAVPLVKLYQVNVPTFVSSNDKCNTVRGWRLCQESRASIFDIVEGQGHGEELRLYNPSSKIERKEVSLPNNIRFNTSY